MSIELIIEQLIAHDNQNVDDFNTLFDKFEEQNIKYKALLKSRDEQASLITQQQALIRGFSDVKKKHQQDYNKVNLRAKAADVAEDELAKSRKEAKTLREQVKRLKASNTEKEKKIVRIEKQLKKRQMNADDSRLTKEGFLRNANLGAMYSLFSNEANEGELLQLYPHRLTMRADNGQHLEGYVLVHTNNSGTFVTVALDTDNEARLLSPLDFPEGTPDRTRSLANKFLRSMSPEAEAFARQWMYKVNVVQKGELRLDDLENRIDL